ncbi:PilZ domain-containing protein [uncultured Sphingomonas sp.]|uniref:PilZ domain-containing protein n=1 Tax=uncultured Sphingomonas sp. TaxID=158754 RepID=UPI0035CA34A3
MERRKISDVSPPPAETRSEPRDEVHYRARVYDPGGRPTTMTVVNISPGGLMARIDEPLEIDATIRVTLPMLGQIAADVRWSLGGRIGCRFDRAIGAREYHDLIATLPRS